MDEIDKSLRDLEDSAERFEKNLVSHFDDRKIQEQILRNLISVKYLLRRMLVDIKN